MNTPKSTCTCKSTGRKTMRHMARTLIAHGVFIPALLLLSTQAMASVSLKTYTEINDHVIRLGDLFEGLPHSADKVLGHAPQPGQDMTLNARTLLRVALSQGLEWRPKSQTDYIVLRRRATTIDIDQTKTALRSALREKGLGGNFDVRMPDEHARITLPHGVPATLEIADMSLSSDKKSFEAMIFAPSRTNAKHSRRVQGQIERLVKVPTLKHQKNHGDIIRAHDIIFTNLAERHVTQGLIMKAEDLIGTTPRRFINGEEPVKRTAVEFPKIVKRGELITMIFHHGPLRLTARGKALEQGAKGDLIRVVNTSSNQTIEGYITSDSEVTIRTY